MPLVLFIFIYHFSNFYFSKKGKKIFNTFGFNFNLIFISLYRFKFQLLKKFYNFMVKVSNGFMKLKNNKETRTKHPQYIKRIFKFL